MFNFKKFKEPKMKKDTENWVLAYLRTSDDVLKNTLGVVDQSFLTAYEKLCLYKVVATHYQEMARTINNEAEKYDQKRR